MSKTQKGLLPDHPILDRREYNKPLIEIIIQLLNHKKDIVSDNTIEYDYLLNQTIRQYIIPNDHWRISVAAKELWDSLTSVKICQYNYRQVFVCNRAANVRAKKFKGSKKRGTSIAILRDSKHHFNEFFVAEHMTPVADIKDQLEKLNNPTIEQVEEILDKIYICRITKKEDRSIQPKYKRGIEYDDICKKA